MADNEFLERINNEPLNPGGAWTLRKDIWEQFLVDGKFDYTYSERMFDSLRSVISLLKNDPDTRKAVLPIFNGNITMIVNIMMVVNVYHVPCIMIF